MIFHGMATPKFVCTFGLFPHFGYYKQGCCKQLWASFCVGMVLFTLDKYLRGELLSHRVILLTLRNHQIVVPFTFPPAPLIGTCVWGFFLEPSECEMVSHCGFAFYFLNDSWFWTAFHVFVGRFHIVSGEMSIQVLWSLLNWVFCHFVVELWEFLIFFG